MYESVLADFSPIWKFLRGKVEENSTDEFDLNHNRPIHGDCHANDADHPEDPPQGGSLEAPRLFRHQGEGAADLGLVEAVVSLGQKLPRLAQDVTHVASVQGEKYYPEQPQGT